MPTNENPEQKRFKSPADYKNKATQKVLNEAWTLLNQQGQEGVKQFINSAGTIIGEKHKAMELEFPYFLVSEIVQTNSLTNDQNCLSTPFNEKEINSKKNLSNLCNDYSVAKSFSN